MSDVESVGDEILAVEEEPENVSNLTDAIKRVLKIALVHDGVVRGLHEVAKVVDGKRAHVCFVSEECSEPAYKKLLEALCAENNIPLIAVEQTKDLGQWAGLCKIDKEGLPRNIVGASSVAITDFGEESQALSFLQQHIKNIKN